MTDRAQRRGDAPRKRAAIEGMASAVCAVAKGSIRLGEASGVHDRLTPMANLSANEIAIVAALRRLKRGEVVAYGEVARRAGLPGRARLVARVLAHSPVDGLPWHRVLRADGRIAFAPGSAEFVEQVRRLQAEGVSVSDGRVSTAAVSNSLDALLWAPPPSPG